MDTNEIATAYLSPCGLYRYRLTRTWGNPQYGHVVWVMLNPSTADSTKDDPTIRRCRNFSKAWGFAGLHVVNLYAYRTPHPKELRKAWLANVDIVGPSAMGYLLDTAASGTLVMCAWGQLGPIKRRADDVLRELQRYNLKPHALAYTERGEPRHPLMLPNGLDPLPM